jgi:glyoxylase I family protein
MGWQRGKLPDVRDCFLLSSVPDRGIAMNKLALAHVCIRTNDLEATRRFYEEGLGCVLKFRFTRNGKVIGHYFEAGSRQFIEVFLVDEKLPATRDRGLDHFCMETGDIEGLRDRLVKLGYEPGEIKKGCDQSWQFWMKDPNGIAIEFQQYTDMSAQLLGGDVEVDW